MSGENYLFLIFHNIYSYNHIFLLPSYTFDSFTNKTRGIISFDFWRKIKRNFYIIQRCFNHRHISTLNHYILSLKKDKLPRKNPKTLEELVIYTYRKNIKNKERYLILKDLRTSSLLGKSQILSMFLIVFILSKINLI